MDRRRFCLLAAVVAVGCEDRSDSSAPSVVPIGPRVADTQAADQLRAQLAAYSWMSADELLQKRALPWTASLGYDPASAVNVSLVQASALKLDDDELAALKRDGFVISNRKQYDNFFYAYKGIYSADLPVYVSADSILSAVHRSYDKMLMELERSALSPDMSALLDAMRAQLKAGAVDDFPAQVRGDVDLYLAVASSLLADSVQSGVAGADTARIQALFDKAKAASGTDSLVLFGDVHDLFDWSQFAPRGHYKDKPALEQYFRAQMWLGRVELRIVRTASDGRQVFQRPSLYGAVALRRLMDSASLARWKHIDAALRAFVGEPDSMAPPDVDAFLTAVGAGDVAALDAVPDQTLAQAVIDGGWGAQRICSQMMVNGIGRTLPLDRSFLLNGQRYVVDSHVFSNLVYDRAGGGSIRRMMPDPLDVAYAGFGNDHAAALLAPQLQEFPYAPDLEKTRALVEAHDQGFWSANLYNAWLAAIRALSPSKSELADPAAAGLPKVFASERWGRRVLNAQLASWAELRHDTLLYAKQSFSGIPVCEYPDAYVEPVPAFFKAVGDLARKGTALVPDIADSSAVSPVTSYFTKLAEVADTLQEMAEHQRTGTPHSEASLAFINRAVSMVAYGCASGPSGWYLDLLYDGTGEYNQVRPTIADVHTQPADAAGGMVGRVLHVGTGRPRLMVVTVETCSGPRAYVGPVSSYYEKTTEQFQRLDDDAWVAALSGASDVPWMSELIVR